MRWSADLRWSGERSDRNFSVFPADRVTLESYTLVNLGLDATIIEVCDGGPGSTCSSEAKIWATSTTKRPSVSMRRAEAFTSVGRIRWEDR